MSSPVAIPGRVHPPAALAMAAILAIAIGLLFAIDRLGPPYYAVAQLIGYGVLFGYIVARLRDCFRAAGDPRWASRLRSVAVWLGLTAVGVLANIPALLRAQDRDFIRLATDCCPLFALMYALELIESILKEATSGPVAPPGAAAPDLPPSLP